MITRWIVFACVVFWSHGRRVRAPIDALQDNISLETDARENQFKAYLASSYRVNAPNRVNMIGRHLLAFQPALAPSHQGVLNNHRVKQARVLGWPQFIRMAADTQEKGDNTTTIGGAAAGTHDTSHHVAKITVEKQQPDQGHEGARHSIEKETQSRWWRTLVGAIGAASLFFVGLFADAQRRAVQAVIALRWWIPVLALVVQNTGLVLTMRYSRLHMTSNGAYLASSAVVCAEGFKLIASAIASLIVDSQWDFRKHAHLVKQEIIEKYDDMLKLSIPAFLYMIQNNLQYFATSNMSAPLCQVLYQMKLLTTALFSVILLRRRLTSQQWASLMVLALGVGVVQYSQMAAGAFGIAAFNMIGVIAVLCSCMTSGLAGAVMELLLKTAKHSVWMRAFQFSLLGMAMSGIACVKDASLIAENGFFGGFTPIVWAVVLLQAFGGLMVALVVKNADNLVKGFATSLSILLSCALSHVFFRDLVLHPLLFLGAIAVVGSTYWFGSCSTDGSWIRNRFAIWKDRVSEVGVYRRLMCYYNPRSEHCSVEDHM